MDGVIDDEPARGGTTRPVRGAGAAGRLVMALLGDYWFASTELVPSSVLVDLAAESGASEAATRAALSRLSRVGWLEVVRSGRTTSYRLAAHAHDGARRVARMLASFAVAPVGWDGRWTCVAFSLPASDARTRGLCRRLRQLGLSPLFDGLWIAPSVPVGRVGRAVEGVAPGAVAVFRAEAAAVADGADLLSPWDLAAIEDRYRGLSAWLADLRRDLSAGSLAPAEALVARTELTLRWHELVGDDPRLPDELLPDPAARDEARTGYVEAYDGLGPLAELRARQIAGDRVTPAALPRHRRVADMC
jgi:phenylacetic acid degradation operon negative regulatory protein